MPLKIVHTVNLSLTVSLEPATTKALLDGLNSLVSLTSRVAVLEHRAN